MTKGSGATWLIGLPLAFLLVFLGIPLLTVVVRAFSKGGFRGFWRALSDPLFVDSVLRTAAMAAVVTALCVVFGLCYSFAIALARGWLRATLLGTVFVTFWVSIVARTYGWVIIFQPTGVLYDVLHDLGLRNAPLGLLQTKWAIYPAMVHVMVPFVILPVFASLVGMDARQIAAAQSLGARPLRTVWHVVLPQLRAGLVAGGTLVFLLSLGFFVTPAFLGGPSDLTIGTTINREFRELFDFPSASAMGAGLLIFVLVAYVVADRRFGIARQLAARGESEWQAN